MSIKEATNKNADAFYYLLAMIFHTVKLFQWSLIYSFMMTQKYKKM